MHACILSRVAPGMVLKALEEIKKVKGVVKAFPVYGRYDIVVFVEAPDFNSISEVSWKINTIKGLKSTETAIEG